MAKKRRTYSTKEDGFSLVELSIVLVILGLLTGGILAGQSLIRAAELRSITTEIDQYKVAVSAFQTKYFALPGDMPNATDFWGEAHATHATCVTTASTGTETCNGNNNGQIHFTVAVGTDRSERWRFWQHLANAGLISGTYTGVTGPGGYEHALPGFNAPVARMSGTGYGMSYIDFSSGANAWWYSKFYGNVFVFGAIHDEYEPFNPALTPAETWSIDEKFDDGESALGTVMTFKSSNPATPGCSTTDVITTAEYDLTDDSILCALIVTGGF